jgi:hypothetical protein
MPTWFAVRVAGDLAIFPFRGMSLRLLKFSGGSVDDYAICRSS